MGERAIKHIRVEDDALQSIYIPFGRRVAIIIHCGGFLTVTIT